MSQKNTIAVLAGTAVLCVCFFVFMLTCFSTHKPPKKQNNSAVKSANVFSKKEAKNKKQYRTKLKYAAAAIAYEPSMSEEQSKYSLEEIERNMPKRYYTAQNLFDRAKIEAALNGMMAAIKQAKQAKQQKQQNNEKTK